MREINVDSMLYAKGMAQVHFSKYQVGDGDRVAIQLSQDHEPLCTATVNIPEYPLGTKEVLIKDWSENEGVFEALLEAGIVKDTGKAVRTGFVIAHVAELLVEPDNAQG
jgi:hypothetical protein